MKLVVYTKEDFDQMKLIIEEKFKEVREGALYKRRKVFPFTDT